jgi:hypothetical protein
MDMLSFDGAGQYSYTIDTIDAWSKDHFQSEALFLAANDSHRAVVGPFSNTIIPSSHLDEPVTASLVS